jgi:nitrogen fixation protein FixH
MAASSSAETWKNFPRYLILAMGLVVAVNARFIYVAVTTFPGEASSDDFDTSNNYDIILKHVAAQDALGWTEQAKAQGANATIDLTGPDHKALTGATIAAQAERPLGPDMTTKLTFTEAAPGHYVSVPALPRPGQWDVKLTIGQGGHTVHVTRRLMVK